MPACSLFVAADGTVTGRYVDGMSRELLGMSAVIERATTIEPDNDKGDWVVRPARGGDPLFRHASRQACEAWEANELDSGRLIIESVA